MADGRARIVAELAGQSQVVSGLKSIGGALSGLASQGLNAAGILKSFDLGPAIAEAKSLDLQVARLGVAAGRAGEELKRSFEGLEQRILTPADRIAGVSTVIGRMTGNMKFGINAVGALGDEALATGQQLEDMVGFGMTLERMGVAAEETADQIGRLRAMAANLRTVGGPVALYNTLAAMGPQLENVSFKTDQARDRWTAFIARATKGMRPEQAKQTASRLMQEAQTRALDVEHATGKRQRDDQGRLLDPFAVLETVSKMTKRYQGSRQARWAFEDALGPEAGAALNNLDTKQTDDDVRNAKARNTYMTPGNGVLRLAPPFADLAHDLDEAQKQRHAGGEAQSLIRKIVPMAKAAHKGLAKWAGSDLAAYGIETGAGAGGSALALYALKKGKDQALQKLGQFNAGRALFKGAAGALTVADILMDPSELGAGTARSDAGTTSRAVDLHRQLEGAAARGKALKGAGVFEKLVAGEYTGGATLRQNQMQSLATELVKSLGAGAGAGMSPEQLDTVLRTLSSVLQSLPKNIADSITKTPIQLNPPPRDISGQRVG